LEEKGAITHEVEGRTFVFVPLVAEDKYKNTATRDLLDRVFGGDVRSLVAHLLQHEEVSHQELDDIRRLIEQRGDTR
jgi:BlaI family penicillinase repressor